MKSLLIALTLVCGSFAMAAEPATTTTAPATTEVKKEEVKAPVEAKKEEVTADKKQATAAKKSVKQAKDECLKENAALKGKELTACVKTKRTM
jgi:hypothetical protein